MATDTKQQKLGDNYNGEPISIVWLDSTMNESEQNINAQAKLRKFDTNLKTFKDKDECDQYVKSQINKAKIILIANGSLGEEIVKSIQYLAHIISIYIYCWDVEKHKKWANNFEKIKLVHNEFNLISKDIEESYFEVDNEPTKEQKNAEIRELDMSYFISDYSMTYASQIKQTPIDKDSFVLLCQTDVKDPNATLQEFQLYYSSDKPLKWLKKSSMFTRILNRAFKMINIDMIYDCRFFLHDLRKQFETNKCTTKIQVYRGELMNDEKFQQLKALKGKTIAVNSFYFTTLNEKTVLAFMREMNNMKRIRFEIEADPEIQGVKPFIKTDSFPDLLDQDGVIFMIGSVFQINEIRENENGIVNVKMVLCAVESNDPFKDQLNNTNVEKDIFGYVQLQSDMSQYFRYSKILDDTSEILQKYHKEIPDDQSDRIRYFDTLGKVYFAKKNYDLSLNYHQQSLELKEKILQSNDPNLIDTYNNIGFVHIAKRNNTQALDAFKQSLNIAKQIHGDKPQTCVPYYDQFAKICESDGNFKEALSYHFLVYSCLLNCYDVNAIELAGCYNNIGKTYFSLVQYPLALGFYETSLKIKLDNSEHFSPESIALAYRGLASVYKQMGNIDQARTHFDNSAKIYREIYSDTHETVLEIERIIQILSPKPQ